MALVLFDSNILIDALKGYEQALQELAYWDEPAISVVTWMEVYAGATPNEVPRLDELMANIGFEIIQTDEAIMKLAAQIRGESIRKGPKIALPDAIIMATAMHRNLTVITRNKRDFKGQAVRIPYELVTNTTVEVINAIPPGQERAMTDVPEVPMFTPQRLVGTFWPDDDEPKIGPRPTLTRLR